VCSLRCAYCVLCQATNHAHEAATTCTLIHLYTTHTAAPAVNLVQPNSAATVTVAVIDTGVHASHPDLAASIVGGKTFIAGAKGNEARWDVDGCGHGTHVSGKKPLLVAAAVLPCLGWVLALPWTDGVEGASFLAGARAARCNSRGRVHVSQASVLAVVSVGVCRTPAGIIAAANQGASSGTSVVGAAPGESAHAR
jgi:hypothetical protein